MTFTTYDSYVRAEWRLFAADPAREAMARDALASLTIRRVLDVGCGAGQELRPFVREQGTLGVGIDLSSEIGVAGRDLFATEQPGSQVVFVRAAAERLPLLSSSVDAVICRLALPYTDNGRALAEIARVLRPGGALLLKFHHARFYLQEFRDGLVAGELRSVVHAARVLLAGVRYHLTGRQPEGGILTKEVFQTLWCLRRELRRHGLEIRRHLGDSRPAAPSLLIERR